MSSGVKITDECKKEYNNIKMGHSYRYIVFKLSDDLTEVIVEKVTPPEATFDDMAADLKAAADVNECRYSIIDVGYVIKGVKKSKLVFIAWSPDNAKVKQKMVYASTKESFKKELGTGLSLSHQATEDSELNEEDIVNELKLADRQ